MSHFSTLRTKITNGELLIHSLQDLGFEVKTQAPVRGHECASQVADIVAVLSGDYDLGWSRNAQGSYDLIADLWAIAKEHNQTELINAINQKYTINQAMQATQEQGLSHADVRIMVS